jgi:hypothetical protein
MATATTENFVQYAGDLYMLGNANTPFLSALGPGGRVVNNFDFALSSTWTVASGAQNVRTETEALSLPTAANYTRDQDVNSCQIVQGAVTTTYKMLSSYNKMIGDSNDYGSIAGPNAIDDVHNHNLQAELKRIYTDLNWACWRGAYARSTGAGVAGKSRGLDAAITTHATATGDTMANLTKADIDNHLAGLADAGVPLDGVVIWLGSEAKIKISNLYSLNLQTQPRDRKVGGVDIQTLETDFGAFGIAYDAHIPTKHIFFINMGMCSNVWCPVPGKGNLFYEEKATAGAARSGMLYGQWGLDYGAEEFHSVITTS